MWEYGWQTDAPPWDRALMTSGVFYHPEKLLRPAGQSLCSVMQAATTSSSEVQELPGTPIRFVSVDTARGITAPLFPAFEIMSVVSATALQFMSTAITNS